MKKITLVLALMLLFISNSEAQKKGGVSQNKWGFGPELDLGISAIYKDAPNFPFMFGIKGGVFVNYHLTNDFALESAVHYDFRNDFDRNLHYINIPAIARFDFSNKNYLGIGAQYSQCLNAPNIPGTSYNYLSAVLEYSYMSRFSTVGNITYIAKDKIFRHTLRIGYGITPITGIKGTSYVKSNIFFIEGVIKWDILNQEKGRNKSRGKSGSKSKKRR